MWNRMTLPTLVLGIWAAAGGSVVAGPAGDKDKPPKAEAAPAVPAAPAEAEPGPEAGEVSRDEEVSRKEKAEAVEQRRRSRISTAARRTKLRPARLNRNAAKANEPAADEPATGDDGSDDEAADASGPTVTGKVVFGDPATAQKFVVVDVDKVFAEIPAYRKIKQESVSKSKARYHILIAQANEDFQVAVQLVALQEGADVVVEKGGLKGVKAVDITDAVLKRIKR